VKRLTLFSATHVGANIKFLQIGKRHTPFSALHQFFPTLPLIWAQVAAKLFCEIQEASPLKLKKNVQRPDTKAIPAD
jgi:hypothetical protein